MYLGQHLKESFTKDRGDLCITEPTPIKGKYVVKRDEAEDLFSDYVLGRSFDAYGHWLGGDAVLDETGDELVIRDQNGDFNNGTFIMRPFYWGNKLALWNASNFHFLGDEEHEPFALWWYKYPLRAAVADRSITYREFAVAMKICEMSIRRIEGLESC